MRHPPVWALIDPIYASGKSKALTDLGITGQYLAKVEWKVSAVQEAGFIENPWQVVFKRVIRKFSINCCALLTVKTVN